MGTPTIATFGAASTITASTIFGNDDEIQDEFKGMLSASVNMTDNNGMWEITGKTDDTLTLASDPSESDYVFVTRLQNAGTFTFAGFVVPDYVGVNPDNIQFFIETASSLAGAWTNQIGVVSVVGASGLKETSTITFDLAGAYAADVYVRLRVVLGDISLSGTVEGTIYYTLRGKTRMVL